MVVLIRAIVAIWLSRVFEDRVETVYRIHSLVRLRFLLLCPEYGRRRSQSSAQAARRDEKRKHHLLAPEHYVTKQN